MFFHIFWCLPQFWMRPSSSLVKFPISIMLLFCWLHNPVLIFFFSSCLYVSSAGWLCCFRFMFQIKMIHWMQNIFDYYVFTGPRNRYWWQPIQWRSFCGILFFFFYFNFRGNSFYVHTSEFSALISLRFGWIFILCFPFLYFIFF